MDSLAIGDWAALFAPLAAVGVVIFVARVRRYPLGTDIGLRAPAAAPALVWAFIWILVAVTAEYASSLQGADAVSNWRSQYSTEQIVVRAFQIALLYPIAEELVFRGLLFHVLDRRAGWIVAVLGSSLLFTIGHFDRSPLNLLITFVDGTLYAIARRDSGSVFVPMALHMAGNSFAVAQRLGMGFVY